MARDALLEELATFPKPGLVSHMDAGSHHDMDAGAFLAAIAAITPHFADLARAGAARAPMVDLRRIGLRAESAMLRATGGVNTHRGAIFGLGLLVAAAGASVRAGPGELGGIVRRRWGAAILAAPLRVDQPGAVARRRFRVGGAPAEAAAGFPSIYRIALPMLARHRDASADAARVEACLALIAAGGDTNLLHRGGVEGARFAEAAARRFMAGGGTARRDWRDRAAAVHDAFVDRRLSPGGAADLLAMALFVARIEAARR